MTSHAKKSLYLSFFILVIHFFTYAEGSTQPRINIVALKNGKGLEKDYNILEIELGKLGYQVNYVDMFNLVPPSEAEINIFLETGNEYFFPYAKKNYLIPNPEWYTGGTELMQKFDLILCKTKEAQRIFGKHNPNTQFISFTCDDCYLPYIIKSYKLAQHFSGSSAQKGTTAVENVWLRKPHFSTLYLIKNLNSKLSTGHNIIQINGYIPHYLLKTLQNSCGLHLCPSETEGFGHTILEAMSTEAVVVATNAPPMNEFVRDTRCLVSYNGTGSQYLATTYYVEPLSLEQAVANLLILPEEELMAIGKRNRQFFLENDAYFKKKLAEIFDPNKIK